MENKSLIWAAVVLVPVALALPLAGCKKDGRATPTATSQVASQTDTTQASLQASTPQAEIDAAKQKFNLLKQKFTYKKDGFKNTETYSMDARNFGLPCIWAQLSYTERTLFCAALLSDEHGYIKTVYVKIGEEIRNFDVEPQSDISMFEPTEGMMCLEFIATSQGQEVSVRFSGEKDIDFTLNKANIQAICDIVELNDAAITLWKAGIDLRAI